MKNLTTFFFLSFMIISTFEISAQQDKQFIRKVFDKSLTEGSCYDDLQHLCKKIGGRLSGSKEAQKAVDWAFNTLNSLGLDAVYKQEVWVPHWERGEKEQAKIITGRGGEIVVPICALGGSVATPIDGIKAGVVEVFTLDELKKIGRKNIEGKFVFFNRPMDPKLIDTFHSYGGCVDQRSSGAAEAAPFGAVGVIVRSMNLRLDDLPHTGTQRYKEGVRQIPTAAISTNGAEQLSQVMKKDPNIQFYMKMSCKTHNDKLSHNVIGEIKGTKYPDEIILIGGHLDSWDTGEGAHDDGAGVVQSIEVLRLFKEMNHQPERTIRCVLWMNEENGARGALQYAEMARKKGEKHLVAIESDRGGFTPRGFTVDGINDAIKDRGINRLKSWEQLLEPYNLHKFEKGYGGVDINYLKDQEVTLMGYIPDPQRYFDYHHAPNDNLEAVNKRELELGAASITSLVYLLSKYGLEDEK